MPGTGMPYAARIAALLVALTLAAWPAPAGEPAAPPAAGAEDKEKDDPAHRLQEVVVTASRRETLVKDAPVMVTRVDREELESSQPATVDEHLRKVPGISTMRTHVAECGPGREMTLRGIPDQRRTLVLVDGMPMNDGFSGAVNWSLVPVESVEGIEIVPGPMSALYGSGAMGGVINIVTQRPTKPSETVLKSTVGSHHTHSTFFQQSGTDGRHGYLLSGRFYETDGYMKVEDPAPYHIENERSDWSLMGRYFFAPDDVSRLTLGLHAVDEKYSRGRVYTEQDNEMTGAQLTYERELAGGGIVSGSLYGNRNYREVEVSGPPPTYGSLDSVEADDIYRLGPSFKISLPLGGMHVLTAGADLTYNTFDKDNDYYLTVREARSEGKQLLASVYAQDEITLGRGDHKFIVTAGVRGDYCTNYDGEMFDSLIAVDEDYRRETWSSFNPKVGLVYQYAEATTVRLAAGTAFAAPTLMDMYTVFRRGPITFNGNPELDPERSFSFNAGFDRSFGERVLLRLDAYYTKGDDFISSRLVTPPFTYMNDNISEVEIFGAELELRCKVAAGIAFYLGYSHTEPTVVEDDAAPANDGNDLPFQPRHKGRAGLEFSVPQGLRLNVSASYVGERYTGVANTDDELLDPYVSVDLFISQKLGRFMEASLRFENLLDDRYEVYSLPLDESYAPGLLITAGLKVTF